MIGFVAKYTWKSSVYFFSRIENMHVGLQQRQKDLLGEWKNSCNSTLKWLSDTSARVEAQDVTAPDLDHARAQRQEIEVFKLFFCFRNDLNVLCAWYCFSMGNFSFLNLLGHIEGNQTAR